MKKLTFLTAAAAAMALAACTDSDELAGTAQLTGGETPENAVSFSSKVGRSKQTRAGYEGNMNTSILKTKSFGVFAYHTSSASTYNYYNTAKESSSKWVKGDNILTSAGEANFMWNQKVEWKTGTSYADYITGDAEGMWSYEPIKYWPNDFSNSDVDDQEKDMNDATAWGSNDQAYSNSRVSFFAYAPYVYFSANGSHQGVELITTADSEHDALPTGVTQEGTKGAGLVSVTKNNESKDPILRYVLNQAHAVDLLWGTAGNTSNDLNNNNQTGRYTGYNWNESESKYDNHSKYPVNINLNKQTTQGVVDFAFKHALASIGGGSNVSSGIGFQVVLDLDDMKGAETGGERESFTVSSSNYFRTIVTIKSIEISNDLDGDKTITTSGTTAETQFISEGTFNLATGEWISTKNDAVVSQTIGTTDKSASEKTDAYSAQLNKKIAEYQYYTDGSTNTTYINSKKESNDYKPYFEKDNYAKVNTGTHPGVTEEPQNVFEDATQNPFMIIPDPNATDPKLRFTVDYVVRTYDENLKNTYSEVHQKVSKAVKFPTFEMNKHYDVVMHLGLTGVKFTASVSDWDEGTIIDSDADGVEDNDIYLPINVSTALELSSANTEVDANTTSATVKATLSWYDMASETMQNKDVSSDTKTAWTITNADGTAVESGISVTNGTVTLKQNTTLKNRSYIVTATYTDGSVKVSQDIVITQKAAQISLTRDGSGNIYATSGTMIFTVKVSSDAVDISSSAVTVKAKKGSEEVSLKVQSQGDSSTNKGKLTITIPDNNTSGTISWSDFSVTIDDTSATSTETVTQDKKS